MTDSTQRLSDEQIDLAYSHALETAAKTSLALEWNRFGGDSSKLDDAFAIAKGKGLDFQDKKILIGGKPTQFTVAELQKSPEHQAWFPALAPKASNHEALAPKDPEKLPSESLKASSRINPAKELSITPQQLGSNFMRRNGLKYLASGETLLSAIETGTVKVASEGTLSESDLSIDLPGADGAVATPGVTEISKADLLDRLKLRKLEARYASVGGYLAAVARGLIVVR
jgi:hypothetical protein